MLCFQASLANGLLPREHELSTPISQYNFPTSIEFTVANAGGEMPYKANIVRNGNMEAQIHNGAPEDFNYWGSSYQIVDSAYQGDVHSGSYAGYQAGKGTNQYSANAYNYRYLPSIPELAYLNQKIYLDFWYNAKANPDILIGGEIYFYSLFTDGSYNKLIFYYLSCHDFNNYNNDSVYSYIDLRGSLATWTNIQRNATLDYEQSFGSITGYYLHSLYFAAKSPVQATSLTELIIDDVSLTNSSAFNYCSNNGDFDDGLSTGWINEKMGPASAQLISTDKTEGEKALNMSASSPTNGGYAYQNIQKQIGTYEYLPIGYYASNPGDYIISFDWKYSDILNGGLAQFAKISLQAMNTTFYFEAHYYLGHSNGYVPNINSTSSNVKIRAYEAKNFGSRDIWNSFYLDLHSLYSAEGITNLITTNFDIQIYAGYQANSSVILLVDDLRIRTYPNGDPSFEEAWYWSSSNPIMSWHESHNHNFVNLTSQAHLGNKALNITAYNDNGYVSTYRNDWMAVERNLFTDFWWRLETVADEDSLVAFDIKFNEGYNLVYILGSSSTITRTNDSHTCFYYVDNFNQTGEWFNLVRNIYTDAVAAFGVSDYEIIFLGQYCYASGAGVVTSALFDDLYFVLDTTPPEITGLAFDHFPVYYQDTIIYFHVTDALSDVSEVTLYYRDAITWYTTTAVNLGGGQYQGTIPQDDFGVEYYFYINATDSNGNFAIEGPHSFTIADDIDPEITNISPVDYQVVSGVVTITVDCFDEGSGISLVEFYVSPGIGHADTLGPEYTYDLNTTILTNGYHTIDIYVYDGAENCVMDTLIINVQNAEPTPTPSSPTTETGTLFGGIIGFLSVTTSTFIITIIIKRKRAEK